MEKQQRILVVFFTRTGSTKLIAEEIAGGLDADLLQLQLQKPLPEGGRAFAIGGLQASLGVKAQLQPWDRDLASYDIIIIGTPVWAWHTTPAFNRFCAQAQISQPYALFSCSGDTPPKKLFTKAIRRFGKQPLVASLGLANVEGTRDASIARARTWAAELRAAAKSA